MIVCVSRAYQEARLRVANIPVDNGDARPQIISCFSQSDPRREINGIAFIG
jgi:hypothetical protein